MSLTTSEMTPADIRACTCGNDGNGGMWGGDWFAYILLFALLGGGGFGFGGFGGGGILPWLLFGNGGFGGAGASNNYVLATDFANIERKLDGVNNGLADGFYAQNTNMLNGFASVQSALCQGFNGLQQTAMQGFHGVDNAVCTLGYNVQGGFNNISHQIADCCCATQGAIKDVGYNIEKTALQNRFDAQAYNCNTLQAIDKVGDRIIDYLANEKTQALRDENFALRLAASQSAQNAYLIGQLAPKCPEPAYIVQPPQQVTFPTNCCGTVNYATNGCGCGSF